MSSACRDAISQIRQGSIHSMASRLGRAGAEERSLSHSLKLGSLDRMDSHVVACELFRWGNDEQARQGRYEGT